MAELKTLANSSESDFMGIDVARQTFFQSFSRINKIVMNLKIMCCTVHMYCICEHLKLEISILKNSMQNEAKFLGIPREFLKDIPKNSRWPCFAQTAENGLIVLLCCLWPMAIAHCMVWDFTCSDKLFRLRKCKKAFSFEELCPLTLGSTGGSHQQFLYPS